LSSDDDRPPDRARRPLDPSSPADLRFSPVAAGFGVFTAIAIPIVIVGYTRSSGVNGTIIVIGIAVGILAGVIAGLWIASRDGYVWRGPQL
jgi:hypothetical protein